MKKFTSVVFVLALLAMTFLACGGGETAEPPPAETSAPAAAPAEEPAAEAEGEMPAEGEEPAGEAQPKEQ